MAAPDRSFLPQPALFVAPAASATSSSPLPLSQSRPRSEVKALLSRSQQPQEGLFDSHYYDALVPRNHELMEIDRRVDFSFVNEVVAECYTGLGRPPIPPELMLRLCFLKEYTTLSDGELVAQCSYNLLYRRFLHLGGNAAPPDSSSLTVFRQRLGEERVEALLRRLVAGAGELGLLGQDRVHVDSTGIAADVAAPRPRTLVLQALRLTLEALAFLIAANELEPLSVRWAALDADSEYWRTPERREKHLCSCWKLRDDVAAVYDSLMLQQGWTPEQEEIILEQADLLERVRERQQSRSSSERRDVIASVYDPDARFSIREAKKKAYVGYKEHIAEDASSGIITSATVTAANVDDSTQLQDLVGKHKAATGDHPKSLAADAKYHSGPNRVALAEAAIRALIAVPAAKGEKRGLFTTADFLYDAIHGCVMCPAGQLAFGGKRNEQAQGLDFYFRKHQCLGCFLRALCSTQKYGRSLFISDFREVMQEARDTKDTPEAQQAQVDRLSIERTFAFQKQRQGLRRTRYRGLGRVKIGVYFNIITVDIRRITKLLAAEEAQGMTPRRLLAQAV